MNKKPYLIWNNTTWELGDFYKDKDWAITWLVKNYRKINIFPQYHLGQNVIFYFGDQIKTGEIRKIGLYDDGFLETKWTLVYDIYSNGHLRSVYKESDILGMSNA